MEAILKAIEKQKIPIKPSVVISNKSNARGLGIATKLGVKTEIIESKNFKGSRADYDKKIISVLTKNGVTQKNGIVCLAGFMRIISPYFIKKYKNRYQGPSRTSPNAASEKWIIFEGVVTSTNIWHKNCLPKHQNIWKYTEMHKNIHQAGPQARDPGPAGPQRRDF